MKNSVTIKQRVKGILMENKLLYNAAMIMVGKRSIRNGIKRAVRGSGNVFNAASTAIFANCKLDIVGNNNKIHIKDFCVFSNVTFLIRGSNNAISISQSVRFGYGGSLHIEDENCVIDIGEGATFENVHIAVTEPGSRITIGADCMFAYDVDLRTGDSHSIIDAGTGRRINPAGDIFIGDHVWVAPHCSILKGVEIAKNCIVATRSVVTTSCGREGVILGGSPSRILKENITWTRERIAQT